MDFFGNPTVVQAKVQIDERYSARSPISRAAVTSAPRTTPNYSPSTTKSTTEKSKVEISQYTTYTEEYLRWAAAALALLLVEFLLRTLWLKSLP